MQDKVIYVISVQHTGTWFAIDFLRGHSKVRNEIFQWKDVRVCQAFPPLEPDIWDIMHVHLGTCWHHTTDFAEYDSALDMKCQMPLLADMFVKTFPTVMPVRDPLRAIITRQIRHPDKTHNYIVNGFIYMAQVWERMEEMGPVVFLPVDLNITAPLYDKVTALSRILTMLDLPIEPYVEEYARKWEAPAYNTTPDVALKNWCKAGEKEKVKEALPTEWAYLQAHESKIRPFLEHLGYKELMWYT
jgi:hypothetical protein